MNKWRPALESSRLSQCAQSSLFSRIAAQSAQVKIHRSLLTKVLRGLIMVRQRKNFKSETNKKEEKKTEKEVKVSNAFGWDALEHAKFKLQVFFLNIYLLLFIS